MISAQFHEACKHRKLLLSKSRLPAKRLYSYLCCDWHPTHLCIAKEFAEQNFLLNSYVKLRPVVVMA